MFSNQKAAFLAVLPLLGAASCSPGSDSPIERSVDHEASLSIHHEELVDSILNARLTNIDAVDEVGALAGTANEELLRGSVELLRGALLTGNILVEDLKIIWESEGKLQELINESSLSAGGIGITLGTDISQLAQRMKLYPFDEFTGHCEDSEAVVKFALPYLARFVQQNKLEK